MNKWLSDLIARKDIKWVLKLKFNNMSQMFLIPNEDKNVKLVEEEKGLRMYYVLSCPSNFPKVSFISKGKSYYRTQMFISYDQNMSKRINHAYNKLKVYTMLQLANFKYELQSEKINQLKQLQIKFENYV
jgi:hypothetical protein